MLSTTDKLFGVKIEKNDSTSTEYACPNNIFIETEANPVCSKEENVS